MGSLERPKLRLLRPVLTEHQGQQFVCFQDSLGVADASVAVRADLFQWVIRRFDGTSTLDEIQAQLLAQLGVTMASAELEQIVEQLDRAMILDGPTFEAYRAEYRREGKRAAALAGRSYAATERALRAQLGQFFAAPDGAGMPPEGAFTPEPDAPRLRGVLSPHIDFYRGGPVYTWAYRHLVERSDADVFVILGVAHQACERRFALTCKDFETPLGLARTDRAYVGRIAALAGDHLFDDELAHRTEHSIEFQVVFLQYMLGPDRPFSIVPILVGSFHDLLQQGIDPIEDPEVRRFVTALQAAESACEGKVAYIGGIDLGHIGRQFGDPDLLDSPTLDRLRTYDEGLLNHASDGNAAGWFQHATEAGDRWRTCGLAATYTLLHAIGPARGTVLRYNQAVNPERTCCVSFASLALLEHVEKASEPAPETDIDDELPIPA